MKKKFLLPILLIFLVLGMVFSASCSPFSHKVTVTYNAEQGIIEGEGKYKKGKNVTLTATAKEGYAFDGWYEYNRFITNDSVYTFKMGSKNLTFEARFKVHISEYELKIHYVYSDGTPVQDDYVANVDKDSTYSVQSPIIQGYECDTAIISGTMTTDKEFTVTYTPKTYSLKVNCINGTNVLQTITQTINFNQEYSIDLPEIEHYYSLSNKLQGVINLQNADVSSQIDGSEIILNVEYFNNPVLTIYYKYLDGTQANETYSLEYAINSAYSVISPTIIGYSCDVATVSGTITSSKEVTVTYSPKNYTLKVRCLFGTNVLQTITKSIKYNESYSVNLPSIQNYYTTVTTVEGTINVDNQLIYSQLNGSEIIIDVNYYAISNLDAYNLKINCVVGTTILQTIFDDEINYGDSFSVDLPEIEHYYTFDTKVEGVINSQNDDVASQLNEDIIIINVEYFAKPILTINYLYLDDSVATVALEQEFDYEDEYSILSPKIVGFTPDQFEITGTITEDITVDVYYQPIKYTLTIKFLDKDANPLSPEIVETKTYLDSFSYSCPVINGYTKITEEINGVFNAENEFLGSLILEAFNNESTSIIFVFEYLKDSDPVQVKVEYLDEQGNTLYPATEPVGYAVGSQQTFNSVQIEGYTPDEQTKTVTIPTANNYSVKFIYTKNPYKLTINYLYNDNSIAAEQYSAILKFSDNYSVTSPSIKGYTANQAVVNGTIGAQDVTINVVYNVNSYKITINYLKDDGSVIAPQKVFNSVEFGTQFSENSPIITGYVPNKPVVEFLFDDAADKVVEVIYSLQYFNLTIKYLDVRDDSIVFEQYIESIQYTKSYNVTSPTVEGYTCRTILVSGTMPADNHVVTVYYDPISYSLTINFVNDKNHVIVPQITDVVEYKESYSYETPVVDGFIIPSEYNPNVSGSMPASNTVITVKYGRQSYLLTINYESDVPGFETLNVQPFKKYYLYEERYYVAPPIFYGLNRSTHAISGNMPANDLTYEVKYKLWESRFNFSFVNEDGKQLKSETFALTFSNNTTTRAISVPIIVDGLGYVCDYSEIIFSIANNTVTAFGVIGEQKVDLMSNFESSTLKINVKPLNTNLTVIHRLDNTKEIGREVITQQYGTSVDINYKNLGEGYNQSPTSPVKYTFGLEDNVIYLDYTSKEYKLSIIYLNDLGDNIATTYSAMVKYNYPYSVQSPTIADYTPDKKIISGTMGLTAVTETVIYTIDWETDKNTGEIIIDSAEKLYNFSQKSNLWNRSIKFTEDINMSEYNISPIGNYATPFKGNVNGNNKTIRNISFDNSKIILRETISGGITYKTAYVGLFGYASEQIKDLTIENVIINYSLSTTDNTSIVAGILVGQYTGGYISNVSVNGTISVKAHSVSVGGLVGNNLSAEINNCNVNVTINNSTVDSGLVNKANIGGIAGANHTGSIYNSESNLNVNSFNVDSDLYIGGICGTSSSGFIENCSITKTVDSSISASGTLLNGEICGFGGETIYG